MYYKPHFKVLIKIFLCNYTILYVNKSTENNIVLQNMLNRVAVLVYNY